MKKGILLTLRLCVTMPCLALLPLYAAQGDESHSQARYICVDQSCPLAKGKSSASAGACVFCGSAKEEVGKKEKAEKKETTERIKVRVGAWSKQSQGITAIKTLDFPLDATVMDVKKKLDELRRPLSAVSITLYSLHDNDTIVRPLEFEEPLNQLPLDKEGYYLSVHLQMVKP